jgi:hypothetical protein
MNKEKDEIAIRFSEQKAKFTTKQLFEHFS